MRKFFWLNSQLLYIILIVFLFPFIIYSYICFNKGICRKCKSGKIHLKSYDSDRLYQKYGCSNCEYKYRSVSEHKELTDSELKIRLRDLKFKKICSVNIAQKNQLN